MVLFASTVSIVAEYEDGRRMIQECYVVVTPAQVFCASTVKMPFRKPKLNHPEEWDSVVLQRSGQNNGIDAFKRIRVYKTPVHKCRGSKDPNLFASVDVSRYQKNLPRASGA